MYSYLSIPVEELVLFLEENYNNWLEDPNISSVGVGLRRKGENQVTLLEPVLQFTVKKKIADRTGIEAIGSFFIEKEIEGFRTDVLQKIFSIACTGTPNYDCESFKARGEYYQCVR